MRVKFAVIGLVLAVSIPPCLGAQGRVRPTERTRHISALKDWRFWVGEAAIATAQILDGASTCRAFHRGAIESSVADFGTHNCGVAAGVLGGAFAFDTTLNLVEHKYFVESPRGAFSTVVAFSVPAAVVPIHLQAAVHNFGIAPPPFDPVARRRIGPDGGIR